MADPTTLIANLLIVSRRLRRQGDAAGERGKREEAIKLMGQAEGVEMAAAAVEALYVIGDADTDAG